MTFDSINNATMGAGLGGAVGALSGDKIARNKIAAQKKTRVTKVLSPDVARSPFALGYEDVSKAFSPERSRHKRAEAYEKGAYAGSAGAVGATGYALRGQAKQAKTLATAVKRTGTFKPKPKVTMSPARQMPRAAVKNSALHIARSSAKPLAIGLGTAGALAVTGRAIGEHRKSKGRSYKALPLS